jgi:hypothetical protein
MDGTHQGIVVENLFLQAKLAEILRAAHARKVPLVVLKGLSYLDELYPELDRPVGDIDLLTAPEHISSAAHALEEAGFRWQFQNRGNHHCFVSDGPHPALTELHWDIFNRENPWFAFAKGLTAVDCLRRVRPREFGGVPAFALSFEDELSYACLHAVKEVFSEEKWLEDIRRMLIQRSENILWESWWEELDAKGLLPAIGLALHLATVTAPSDFSLPKSLRLLMASCDKTDTWKFFTELYRSGADLWQWRPAMFAALADGWRVRVSSLANAVSYWAKTHLRPTAENSKIYPFENQTHGEQNASFTAR